ncbi:MAG: 4-alpha-glucanotransferase [Ignavibacteria bacterium]
MDYSSLLNSRSSEKWKRIGINRRAGIALPLFSVYSKNSIGIGEIPDLRSLIDWCRKNSISIIQLLPLNEVGYDYSPYNALSTFALDPMYLSIHKLRKAELKPFRQEIREIKKQFPKGNERVNYEIKNVKLNLLKRIFETVDHSEIKKFREFVKKNIHWLRYYSLFKILAEKNSNRSWLEWDLKYKYISSLSAEKILKNHTDDVNFIYWLQWQLYEQLVTIKRYAGHNNIFLMGDLPFLVSRNSADVWAYKNYFKLSLSSGAPPDMYFSRGQRWGMPPYDWDNIAADKYSYIRERLKYAENFFDMFRIDHFIGLFRIWTIDLKIPEEYMGLYGKFDPEEEHHWEEHGRKILNVINDSTSMLACAEDLGTVPDCSEKVLKEFGITGINVQRWEKKSKGRFEFLSPEEYRINSVSTVSTHDSSFLPSWWKCEAGTIDEYSFGQICERKDIRDQKYSYLLKNLFDENFSVKGRLLWKKEISNVYVLLEFLQMNYEHAKDFIDMYLSSYGEKDKFWRYLALPGKHDQLPSVKLMNGSLKSVNSTSSVFSIQLLIEYLYLDKNILENYNGWDYRINFPGTSDKINWSIIFPVALENLKEMSINEDIKKIISITGRAGS